MPEQLEPEWYSDGLRFTCTQCGDCCTGSPGYVWVDDQELAAIADHLHTSIGELRLLHTRPARGGTSLREFTNGDCTFLDPQTRRCRVYAVRPRQCRTWPFWKSNIATPEAWQKTCSVCPGAGRGEFVPVEDIQALSSVIDL